VVRVVDDKVEEDEQRREGDRSEDPISSGQEVVLIMN
jgi:hypothetical protein